MKNLLILLLLLVSTATLKSQMAQGCDTPPTQQLPPQALSPPDPSLDYCATVKIEVDYTTVQALGGLVATQNKLEPVLTDVATIYRNSAQNHYGITLSMEFEVFYWNEPSPYVGPSSSAYLQSYRQNRQPFTQMVSQLLASGSSGGIAYVDASCNQSFGVSFSNIINQFATFPTYSWNVMVIAHELGHNFGSNHTHACVWNGNNTAIDGCAGTTEGGCPNPGSPQGGGTVMSYCHFTTGIDFTKGFGPQPTAVILNGIAGASCSTCTGNPPPPPPPPPPNDEGCEGNELIVQVLLDYWPGQSYWELKDALGELIATKGPWEQELLNSIVLDTVCVPDGCYTFTMSDLKGNGLGQIGCSEGMYIVQHGLQEVASGQSFAYEDVTNFCLNSEPPNSGCNDVLFSDLIGVPVQDQGVAVIDEDGARVTITGNSWKVLELPYEVTPNTVLSLDLKIVREGEIHGVGFVPSFQSIYPLHTLRLGGTQYWGNGAYDDGIATTGFRHYDLAIGQLYAQQGIVGQYPYLVLVNDQDIGTRNPEAIWKNLVLCEEENLDFKVAPLVRIGQEQEAEEMITGSNSAIYRQGQSIYPNPASDTLYFPIETAYQIYPVAGRKVLSGYGRNVDVSHLPSGVYVVIYEDRIEKLIIH